MATNAAYRDEVRHPVRGLRARARLGGVDPGQRGQPFGQHDRAGDRDRAGRDRQDRAAAAGGRAVSTLSTHVLDTVQRPAGGGRRGRAAPRRRARRLAEDRRRRPRALRRGRRRASTSSSSRVGDYFGEAPFLDRVPIRFTVSPTSRRITTCRCWSRRGRTAPIAVADRSLIRHPDSWGVGEGARHASFSHRRRGCRGTVSSSHPPPRPSRAPRPRRRRSPSRTAARRAPGRSTPFAAYDRAIEMGADYIEQDLQLTSDGVLVVLHDATLDRTARGAGRELHGRSSTPRRSPRSRPAASAAGSTTRPELARRVRRPEDPDARGGLPALRQDA